MRPTLLAVGLALLLQLQLRTCRAEQSKHGSGSHLSIAHSTAHRKPELAGRVIQSALEPRSQSYASDPTISDRDFYVFHNVVLKNDSIIYCHVGGGAPVPEDLPERVRLSRTEEEIDIPVIVEQISERSSGRQTKPGLLFSGPPWDHNFYEFVVNTMMPTFQTAVMTGLLDLGRMEALSEMQWNGFEDREPFMEALFDSKSMSPFTLISGRAGAFASPWTYFLEYWTRDQQTLRRMEGTFFETLVVAEDAVLRFLTTRQALMEDPGYQSYRSNWLARFREHIRHSENVHLRAEKEEFWPSAPQDTGASHKRPRVVIATRPEDRRSLLNEPDIVDHLTKHWDVNVTVSKFEEGLAANVALMQDTDALIGVHGAGLTNSVFMKSGGVLLQILPYGFTYNQTSGLRVRGNIFVDVALCLNGTYLQWENPHPHNAYFREEDWHLSLKEWDNHPAWGPKVGEYAEHPLDDIQKPQSWDAPFFWMYQNTYVDMSLLAPVIDDAMQQIHAKRL